jgi:hypothetical protein
MLGVWNGFRGEPVKAKVTAFFSPGVMAWGAR